MSKENKLIIGSIVAVVIMAIGFTYAYFAAIIEGNRKNITINMTDLRIIFNGGDTIEGSNLYSEDNFDVVKTFTIENKTKSEYKYNLVIEDLVNTTATTGSLVYKITCDDTNGYNMTDFQDLPKALTATNTTLAYNIPIASKALQTYTIEIKYINKVDVNQSADMGAILSGQLFIEKFEYRNKNLTAVMLEDNPTISERTDFSVANTENTTGTLYKTNKTEDGSEVYYYSGNTTNNWVKFGKYQKDNIVYRGYYSETSSSYSEYATLEECTNATSYNKRCTEFTHGNVGDDMYWRIIRTNEDGSVRILYSGTSPDTTEGYIGESEINSYTNTQRSDYEPTYAEDPMYVGYMYGTSGSLENNRTNENDSTIKTYVDTWYQNYLLNNYDKYISKSAVYCNDRSVPNNNYSISNHFDYGAYTRLVTNKAPSYKCGSNTTGGLFESTQAIEDKFSASTEGGGNGQLKYPIALMTADELSFAGGKEHYTLPSPYAWFYSNSIGGSIVGKNEFWYFLSPYFWTANDSFVFFVDGYWPGSFGGESVTYSTPVRPAISLSSCVNISYGDGTPSYPYVIDESSCS